MANRLTNVVDRLLAEAKQIAAAQSRADMLAGNCRGLDTQEIADRFEAALPEGGREVLDEILDQLAEYQGQPPRDLPNGKVKQNWHGLNKWFDLLQMGAASLPDTIPLDVLLAYRDGYAEDKVSPTPMWRCEACHMALPNARPGNIAHFWDLCPVCRSERLCCENMAKPPGHFLEYRPRM